MEIKIWLNVRVEKYDKSTENVSKHEKSLIDREMYDKCM
jgi:hypothetical protein